MRYRVIITPDAKADLHDVHRYIQDRAPRAASEWSRRARSAIKTLSHFPERCPLASESATLNESIRQMIFGSGNRGTYRVLFTVRDKSVYVLYVRHGSMLPLGPEKD